LQHKLPYTKGIVIVYTGSGKGKTTAALGLALRASGHGMRTAMIQFIKATTPTGEVSAAHNVPGLEILPLGKGFVQTTTDGKPAPQHVAAAKKALHVALQRMRSGECEMLILDEVNVALSRGLLDDSELQSFLKQRPPALTLILTGRGAPEWLVNLADLVTEMRVIKFPSLKAQPGIEY